MILKEERLSSINKPRLLAIQVTSQEVQRPQSIARCQVRHCRGSFEASLSLTASVTFDPCPLTLSPQLHGGIWQSGEAQVQSAGGQLVHSESQVFPTRGSDLCP